MTSDASWAPTDRPTAPLSIGDVLSTTLRMFRVHLGTLVGLGAVVFGLPSIGSFFIEVMRYQRAVGTPLFATTPRVGVLLLLVVVAFASLVAPAAVIRMVLGTMEGRAVTVRDALLHAISRFFSLLGTSLLLFTIVIVGLNLCVVPAVIASIWFAVAFPVCVAEGTAPIESLRRSAELTEGSRITIFVMYLVLGASVGTLACCLISPMLQLFVAAFGTRETSIPIERLHDPLTGTNVLERVLIVGLQIAFVPIAWIAPAVIYARLRRLRDGVDANEVAQVFA
jgi:hypothetical protein